MSWPFSVPQEKTKKAKLQETGASASGTSGGDEDEMIPVSFCVPKIRKKSLKMNSDQQMNLMTITIVFALPCEYGYEEHSSHCMHTLCECQS